LKIKKENENFSESVAMAKSSLMEQKATQQCVEAHYVKRSIMRNNLKWPAKVLFVQFTRRLMGNEVVIKKGGYIDYAISQR